MTTRLNRHLRYLLIASLFVLFASIWLPSTAYADDCTRDPLNAADCMRTGGFRQGITTILGVAATTGVILTNTIGGIIAGGGQPVPPSRPQPPSSQPPPRTQPPSGQTPPPRTTPPQTSKPPAQPPPAKQPPTQQPPKQGPPGDAGWLNWDNLKRLVDYPNKLFGIYSKFKLTPDAINAWKKASNMWRLFQNKETAEAYIKATQKRMNPGGKLGDYLDKAGKVMDAVDAVFKAEQVIEARNYQGWEKAGAYYVEGVNKVLCTMLTKNPVVSIIDQVAGDLTGR